jgi:hypothetical protein
LAAIARRAGRTAEIIGRWIKGKRSQFTIATKCVGVMGPKPWDRGMSRKHQNNAPPPEGTRFMLGTAAGRYLRYFDAAAADMGEFEQIGSAAWIPRP